MAVSEMHDKTGESVPALADHDYDLNGAGPAEADLELGILGRDSAAVASPPVAPKARSTAYLDGLRGLAAFFVYMSHHMSYGYGPEDTVQYGFGHDGVHSVTMLPFIRILFTGGSAAVAIFFVLSGYVLSKSPLSMLARGGDARPLYTRLLFSAIRRPFRLFFPVVAVSFAFAVSMHLPFGLAPHLDWPTPLESLGAELWRWFVELLHALNPFVKHGIREQWFPYDPPVWTIAIEFVGSLLVFVLVGLLTRIPVRFRAAFLVVLGLAFLVLYDWAMACFTAGVALALRDVEKAATGDTPQPTRRTALVNGAFVLGWFFHSQTVIQGNKQASLETPGWGWLTQLVPPAYAADEYWRFWNAVGAVLVVFAALRLRWLQRFLQLSPLRYLGRVSFSLYLVHIPIIWTFADRVYRLFGTVRTASDHKTWFDNKLLLADIGPHGFSTRFLVVQMIVLPLTLLVSEWGTVLLDEPSIRIGRWVESKIRKS